MVFQVNKTVTGLRAGERDYQKADTAQQADTAEQSDSFNHVMEAGCETEPDWANGVDGCISLFSCISFVRPYQPGGCIGQELGTALQPLLSVDVDFP